MNRHAWTDRIFLGIARAASWRRGQYFREGADAASFDAQLGAVSLTLPSLASGTSWDLRAATRVGELDCGLRVLQRAAPDAPLLVWNHGGGEIPFERTISRALAAGPPLPATVVALRAPHHRSRSDLFAGVATLERYVALLAVAVALNERVLRAPAFRDARRRVVAGFSLGGFVANRHHLAFDSADAYVPFMAGTAQAEIFLSTYPAARRARAQPDALRAALDFRASWAARAHPNVFPVLGSHDQLNRLDVQAPSYGGIPLEIWDAGHITGANAAAAIRAALARRIATPDAAIASCA